jgi:streptogramin lyase
MVYWGGWPCETGSTCPGLIGRITTAGVFTEYPITIAASTPIGITAGSSDALWFTDSLGYLGQITTAGIITYYPMPSANSSPQGITAGPDGSIWFADAGNNMIGTFVAEALRIVEAGTGTGQVTSNPAGINCNASSHQCAASFAGATQVALTASASARSSFTGWSGGGCSGTSVRSCFRPTLR